jgi:hypothetical protein
MSTLGSRGDWTRLAAAAGSCAVLAAAGGCCAVGQTQSSCASARRGDDSRGSSPGEQTAEVAESDAADTRTPRVAARISPAVAATAATAATAPAQRPRPRMSKNNKRRAALSPASIFDADALHTAFDKHDIKRVHAKKCWQYLFRHPEASLADIPGLPARARELLCGGAVGSIDGGAPSFVVRTSTVHSVHRSVDGTIKLLIRLQDGLEIEAVVTAYVHAPPLAPAHCISRGPTSHIPVPHVPWVWDVC